jgi:hypothetical protein
MIKIISRLNIWAKDITRAIRVALPRDYLLIFHCCRKKSLFSICCVAQFCFSYFLQFFLQCFLSVVFHDLSEYLTPVKYMYSSQCDFVLSLSIRLACVVLTLIAVFGINCDYLEGIKW